MTDARYWWLPIHIGDHLTETRHMTAIERDGYLHLQFEYWVKGRLAGDDDAQLARIAGMTLAQWRRSRPVIQSLFTDGWKHARLDAEKARIAKISTVNADRARKAANKRWNTDAPSMPQACSEHAPSMLDECYPRPTTPSPSEREAPQAPPSPSSDAPAEGGSLSKPKKSKKPKTEKHPLRADWRADVADRKYAQQQGLDDEQINFQERAFCAHWHDPDANDRLKSNWHLAWQKWILRSIGFAKGVQNLPRAQSPVSVSARATMATRFKAYLDSPQADAWQSYWRKKRGVGISESDCFEEYDNGRSRLYYLFPSEWPPDYEPSIAKAA